MKKVIALVLMVVICLLQCACGTTETTQNPPEAATETTQKPLETAEEENKIEFLEPLLMAEDDHICIELVNLFENDSVNGENNVPHKFLSLKCSNKADYEIMVTLRNLSIDGVTVGCTYYMSEPSLLPGETKTFFIYVHDGFYKPLDSLEALYRLEGRFYLYSEGNLSEEIPFSIENARLA